jgi:aldehyde dehydrogenase (NAD+)
MIESLNPSRPSETVASTRSLDLEQALALIDPAVANQAAWAGDAILRSSSLSALAEAIASRHDEFTEMMIREVGKPVAEARGEVDRAIAILRYYSQVPLDPDGEIIQGSIPGVRIAVRRVPLGVVMAICPWNFPLAIPIWKVAPALAYGNTVLLKPAEAAVGTASLLFDCVSEVFPPDVLALLPVSGNTAGEILDDDRIRGVTFTGSTQVGLQVAERMARRGAPTQAEMGGQNPAIVLADADLDSAADAIVSGAMGFAGQKCTATRRAIVVADVFAEMESRLAERVEALRVGDPGDESVTVGPLIAHAAVAGFDRAVEEALSSGASQVAEAELPESDGFFVRPRLLRQDDAGAVVNQEETFGPLLTLLQVSDEEQAIEVANATRYGLVGAVHACDLAHGVEVAGRLECGLQRINAPTPGVDYYAPFGGEGESSFGPREQGRAAREFFTSSRTMTIVPPPT